MTDKRAIELLCEMIENCEKEIPIGEYFDPLRKEKARALDIAIEAIKKKWSVKKMNDEVKLKNCPFCGGEAFVWRTNHMVFIQCSNYNANSHLVQLRGRTMEEATEAWNRRCDND
jgi:hypothetical protein